jgi:hypothetical protein
MNALWFWEIPAKETTLMLDEEDNGMTYLWEYEEGEWCFVGFHGTSDPPNYPLPTTIVRVQGHGLADGLFDIDRHGVIVWGFFDEPWCDGSFEAGNGYDI